MKKNKIKKIIRKTSKGIFFMFVIIGISLSNLPIESLQTKKAYALSTNPGDGILLYAAASNTTPQWRTYTTSTNTFAANAGTVAGAQPTITVVKTSPTKQEAIGAYQDTSGNLRVMCYDGTTWTEDWTVAVAAAGTPTTRAFDVAYETTTGDVTVAYSRNTAATNALAYRTKAGSTGCGTANWAGAANFPTATAVTSATVKWVKSARNGVSGSNLSAWVWLDNAATNADLGAAIWDGSAFTNFKVLETSMEHVTAVGDTDNFDLTYESSSGDLMTTWGNSAGAAAVNGAKYMVCTGNSSSCTWGAATAIPTLANDATNLDIASDPLSDKIIYASIGNGGSDLQAAYWDGSAWTGYNDIDASAALPTAGTKMVNVGWLNNNGNTKFYINYNDSTGTGISWFAATPGTTLTTATGLQTDFAGTALTATHGRQDGDQNPFTNADAINTISDSTNGIFAYKLSMDSSGNLTWSNSANAASLGTKPSTPQQGFHFQYWRYVPPTTTLGDGTDGSSSTIAPGASATEIDRFSLVTNTSSDTVTGLTVTLGPANAYTNIATVGIYTTGGSLKCSGTPSSNSVALTSCGISVNTTPTEYVVKITPKTHANMVAPASGVSYSTTATVTALTVTYTSTGTDTDSATITVDNLSPGEVGQSIAGGTSWTTQSVTGNDDIWNAVTYGNGTFVAVGAGSDVVATSPDGVTWTVQSAAGNNDGWKAVTYGNGTFVAVGNAGDRVMTSSDGVTWTAQSAAGNDDFWYSVAYGNGTFVAIGNDKAVTGGKDRVMTSPDGVTWTVQSAAGNNDDWNAVTYGNGTFVAVGGGADRVMTSPDGVTWAVQSAAGNNDDWRAITYGNGLFVAVGTTTADPLMTSPDGVTWTSSFTVAGNNDFWQGITYGGGVYVVVGTGASSRDSIVTSSDGVTWTSQRAVLTDDWRGISYGNGTLVAIGQSTSGANRAMYSSGTAGVKSVTGGDGQVTVTWNNPQDLDLSKIMVLASTSAITFTPVEGTTYSTSTLSGASRVACYGLQTSCIDTSVSNGTAYYYKIITLDSNGNWSVGVDPTGSPVTPQGSLALDQLHFRWRNDFYSEGTASGFLAAEDTALSSTDLEVGDRVRLRFLIKDTTGSATSYTYRLETASSTCSSGWIQVASNATLNPHWIMDTSTKVSNGDSTTDNSGLTNPTGSFISGFVMTQESQTPALSLTSGQFTELEFSIRSTTAVTRNTAYCFRLTNAGATSVFTYTSQPQITLPLVSTIHITGGGSGNAGGEGNGSGPIIPGGGAGGGGGSESGGGQGGGQSGGGSGGGGGGDLGFVSLNRFFAMFRNAFILSDNKFTIEYIFKVR